MSFQTIELANDQVLVKGTDVLGVTGQTVLDGSFWAAHKRESARESAKAEYDKAIEQFYAPLVAAAEAAKRAVEVDVDPLLHLVVDEGSEGSPARARRVIVLDDDSVILRALEQGATDRLVWVNDRLVLTKSPAQPVSRVVTLEDAADEGSATPAE